MSAPALTSSSITLPATSAAVDVSLTAAGRQSYLPASQIAETMYPVEVSVHAASPGSSGVSSGDVHERPPRKDPKRATATFTQIDMPHAMPASQTLAPPQQLSPRDPQAGMPSVARPNASSAASTTSDSVTSSQYLYAIQLDLEQIVQLQQQQLRGAQEPVRVHHASSPLSFPPQQQQQQVSQQRTLQLTSPNVQDSTLPGMQLKSIDAVKQAFFEDTTQLYLPPPPPMTQVPGATTNTTAAAAVAEPAAPHDISDTSILPSYVAGSAAHDSADAAAIARLPPPPPSSSPIPASLVEYHAYLMQLEHQQRQHNEVLRRQRRLKKRIKGTEQDVTTSTGAEKDAGPSLSSGVGPHARGAAAAAATMGASIGADLTPGTTPPRQRLQHDNAAVVGDRRDRSPPLAMMMRVMRHSRAGHVLYPHWAAGEGAAGLWMNSEEADEEEDEGEEWNSGSSSSSFKSREVHPPVAVAQHRGGRFLSPAKEKSAQRALSPSQQLRTAEGKGQQRHRSSSSSRRLVKAQGKSDNINRSSKGRRPSPADRAPSQPLSSSSVAAATRRQRTPLTRATSSQLVSRTSPSTRSPAATSRTKGRKALVTTFDAEHAKQLERELQTRAYASTQHEEIPRSSAAAAAAAAAADVIALAEHRDGKEESRHNVHRPAHAGDQLLRVPRPSPTRPAAAETPQVQLTSALQMPHTPPPPLLHATTAGQQQQQQRSPHRPHFREVKPSASAAADREKERVNAESNDDLTAHLVDVSPIKPVSSLHKTLETQKGGGDMLSSTPDLRHPYYPPTHPLYPSASSPPPQTTTTTGSARNPTDAAPPSSSPVEAFADALLLDTILNSPPQHIIAHTTTGNVAPANTVHVTAAALAVPPHAPAHQAMMSQLLPAASRSARTGATTTTTTMAGGTAVVHEPIAFSISPAGLVVPVAYHRHSNNNNDTEQTRYCVAEGQPAVEPPSQTTSTAPSPERRADAVDSTAVGVASDAGVGPDPLSSLFSPTWKEGAGEEPQDDARDAGEGADAYLHDRFADTPQWREGRLRASPAADAALLSSPGQDSSAAQQNRLLPFQQHQHPHHHHHHYHPHRRSLEGVSSMIPEHGTGTPRSSRYRNNSSGGNTRGGNSRRQQRQQAGALSWSAMYDDNHSSDERNAQDGDVIQGNPTRHVDAKDGDGLTTHAASGNKKRAADPSQPNASASRLRRVLPHNNDTESGMIIVTDTAERAAYTSPETTKETRERKASGALKGRRDGDTRNGSSNIKKRFSVGRQDDDRRAAATAALVDGANSVEEEKTMRRRNKKSTSRTVSQTRTGTQRTREKARLRKLSAEAVGGNPEALHISSAVVPSTAAGPAAAAISPAHVHHAAPSPSAAAVWHDVKQMWAPGPAPPRPFATTYHYHPHAFIPTVVPLDTAVPATPAAHSRRDAVLQARKLKAEGQAATPTAEGAAVANATAATSSKNQNDAEGGSKNGSVDAVTAAAVGAAIAVSGGDSSPTRAPRAEKRNASTSNVNMPSAAHVRRPRAAAPLRFMTDSLIGAALRDVLPVCRARQREVAREVDRRRYQLSSTPSSFIV